MITKMIKKLMYVLLHYLLWKTNSNYVAHARRELLVSGYDPQQQDGPNKWIQDNVLELLMVFAMQGHSGSSAPYCANVFKKLALFEPLSPLSGDTQEWDAVGDSLFQNRRCSHVFKENGLAYDSTGRVFREPDGSCYTNRDSRVNVTFPYTPKVEYVDTITDQQKQRLQQLVKQLRAVAALVGPLHGWWDVILDIEAFMDGKRTVVVKTAEEWIAHAEKLILSHLKL